MLSSSVKINFSISESEYLVSSLTLLIIFEVDVIVFIDGRILIRYAFEKKRY